MKALIAFGAEVNCLDPSQQTPIHIAQVKHGFESELVAMLIGVGGLEQEAVIWNLQAIKLEQFANGGLGVVKGDMKQDLSGIEKGMIESTEESTDGWLDGRQKAKVMFAATPDASVEMGLSQLTMTEAVRLAMLRGEEETPENSLPSWIQVI